MTKLFNNKNKKIMEKNYVAPEVEVVEVELEGHILTASNGNDNFVDIGGKGEWE